MAAADQRATPPELPIGSYVSVTSISDIRYEGFLSQLNPHLALHTVKVFGTEGRCKSGPQVPANDQIFEYIHFQCSDIKDLQVLSSRSPQSTSVVPSSPAIIQSHFPHPTPTTMASTSHGAAEVAKVSTSVQPILSVTPFQLNQPRHPSALSCSFGSSLLPPPPTNISGLAVHNYWPRLVGSSGGVSHYPPPPQSLVASLPPVQQEVLNVNASPAPVTETNSDEPTGVSFSKQSKQSAMAIEEQSGLRQSSPSQLNQSREPSASSSSFQVSLLPPPPANISRLAVPNYRPGLAGSSGGVSHYPPLPQSLVASQPPVQQVQSQNLHTSVAGGSSFRSTGFLNKLPPLLPTPSSQSNSNLTSTPTPSNKSSALLSVPMDPGPKMASSLPDVLNLNATPAPVTEETNSGEPTGVFFCKQSKISTMTIEEQSGPRQSSPSQSLQTTNINAKTALALEMEPLPSDSIEETKKSSDCSENPPESLLKLTTKTLQGSTSSHRYKDQSARGRDQVHRGPHRLKGRPLGKANVANGVALHTHQSSRSHAVGRGDGMPRAIRSFKEDFDFEAMNAKFNKEEIWNFLRKNNKAEDGNEDDKEMDDGDVKGEAREVHVKDDSKPVYCKDDFFDSLSYGAPDHESAKVDLSEQREKDAETFGVEVPICQQDHGQGSHSARASQASFGGRGHDKVRGSHHRRGRKV